MTLQRKKIKNKRDNELVGVVFGLHRLFYFAKFFLKIVRKR